MASTVFQDYNENNPIVSSWLNDVNGVTYAPAGGKRVAVEIPVAWVRFSVSSGVVTIQQSQGVSSVVRTAAGVYVITYTATLTESTNCYQIIQNVPGFASYSGESINGVTINLQNTALVLADPASACVVVLGAN
jgi:hypothetical protein